MKKNTLIFDRRTRELMKSNFPSGTLRWAVWCLPSLLALSSELGVCSLPDWLDVRFREKIERVFDAVKESISLCNRMESHVFVEGDDMVLETSIFDRLGKLLNKFKITFNQKGEVRSTAYNLS